MRTGPIRAIQDEICVAFGLTRDELLGESKVKEIVHPRILAMEVARFLTQASYPAIGRAFNRDSSTVQSAIKRAQVLMVKYPEYAVRRHEVIRALHGDNIDPS